MAALKIWSIGKANARIEELEAQVSSLTKERDDARTALESNSSEVSASAEQLQKDLGEERKVVLAQAAEISALNASVSSKNAEITSLAAKLAAKDSEVKIQVAQQVASTQAALGQPPMAAAPPDSKAGKKLEGMSRVHAAAAADLAAGGYRPK